MPPTPECERANTLERKQTARGGEGGGGVQETSEEADSKGRGGGGGGAGAGMSAGRDLRGPWPQQGTQCVDVQGDGIVKARI